MRSPMLLLAAAVAAAGVASAAQAKDFAERPTEETPIKRVVKGKPFTQGGGCTLGGNVQPAWILSSYLAPPGDQYYTLISPDDCAGCNGEASITAAHIVLNVQTICSQPVQVSIVGLNPDRSCAKPDPANVIMPAMTFMLEPDTDGLFDFTIPIDPAVCLTDSAFLCFRFDAFGAGCDQQNTAVEIVAGLDGCANCQSWNFYTFFGTDFEDDFCVENGPQVDGPFVHYVDAECCTSTPTVPQSWGSLKKRYFSP